MVTLLFAAVLALTEGNPTVSKWEFNHVYPGGSKTHVERVFDTTGHRVVLWAGPTGWLHLIKQYPAKDGGVVRVRYGHGPNQVNWKMSHRDGKEWSS